jgi:fumarylacetoacetase
MAVKSWVDSANAPVTDFPLANLPYGIFAQAHSTRIGVAIGDKILDLRSLASESMLAELPNEVVDACTASTLNPLMALGPKRCSALRATITSLLSESADAETQRRLSEMLVPMSQADMKLPAQVGDYTDFYASIHHATRVGKLFRPDHPLLPNYKYVPIGYHGRASSIVVSGSDVRRPSGQLKPTQAEEPEFGPARSLDYELEVGIFIGAGNKQGQPIPIAEAEQHVFGLCLLNDWSARDIQSWEYQPLGPFLAKNFATSISPWIVPIEALEPYRVAVADRAADDPAPLPYLSASSLGAFDVHLDVLLQTQRMRASAIPAERVSRGNLKDLYWSIAQLVTHHASNGCNLRPGDLLGTGTISGPEQGSEGCLLEMKHRGEPLSLPAGETRTFLQDGDTVIFRAYAQREGMPRIGFGECSGTLLPAP